MLREATLRRALLTNADLEALAAEPSAAVPSTVEPSTVEPSAGDWRARAWSEFRDVIYDPAFPCFFAPIADRRGTLRYTFVEDTGEENLAHLEAALRAYLDEVRRVERRSVPDAAYHLLVVFVHTPPDLALAREQDLGWELIARLHLRDREEWPEHVTRDPEDRHWSFCWDGVPLFVNISASAHRERRSRRLGGHLALVIQPRDAFDTIAGDTPRGRQVRAQIRARIETYDGMPASPRLGTYGQGESLEWVQYALPDHDRAPTAKSACPFTSLVHRLGRRGGDERDG